MSDFITTVADLKIPPWSLSEKQRPKESKLQWKRQKEKQTREESKGGRWEAAICSETHLSWIVSVSAVEQGDGEAVRVCESLYGVLEKENQKNWNQKETQRCNLWEKQTRQSRQWKASEEQFKNDNQ